MPSTRCWRRGAQVLLRSRVEVSILASGGAPQDCRPVFRRSNLRCLERYRASFNNTALGPFAGTNFRFSSYLLDFPDVLSLFLAASALGAYPNTFVINVRPV